MNRFVTRAAGFLLALTAAVFALAGLLELAGTSGTVMTAMMRTYAPSSASGLPDAEYEGMGLMITRYLAGASQEFQYALDDSYGRQVVLFQQHEQQHMADCKALFVLDRTVLLVSGVLILLLVLFIQSRHDLKGAAGGFLWGACLCAVLVTALAVWAMVDFNGLFVLFHRLSFTNDLWVLNPATDLLIRLMPLGFFISYASLIVGTWLVFLAASIVISALIIRKAKRGTP